MIEGGGRGWSTLSSRHEIPCVTCQPQGAGGLGGRQALPGGEGRREGTVAGGQGGGGGQATRAGCVASSWARLLPCLSFPNHSILRGLTGFYEALGTLWVTMTSFLPSVRQSALVERLLCAGLSHCILQIIREGPLYTASGTFGGRRKAVRDRFALQGGTGHFP